MAQTGLFSSSPRGLKHTAGAIESVGQDLTGATATTVTYDFKVFISGRTAGSIVVTEGSGAVGETIDENGWHNWQAVFNVSTDLGITPTTDFDGTVELAAEDNYGTTP